MRTFLTVAFVSFIVSMGPALAGQVTMNNGQTSWKSTECTRPSDPASLTSMSSEAAAEDMNTKISEYNQYVQEMRVYMACISKEGQADVNHAQEAVASAVGQVIDQEQAHIDALGMSLKSSK